MKAIGAYLEAVVENKNNSKNFRIFSPDELASNKLDGVFKHVSRTACLYGDAIPGADRSFL